MRSRLVVAGVAILAVAVALAVIVGRRTGGPGAGGMGPGEHAPSITGQRAAPPAPVVLAIDGNFVSEPKLFRGWPLIIRATARAAGNSAVTLATTGPWPGSVKLIVIANGGGPAAWPLVATPGATSSMALGTLTEADATWTLAPEFTRTLAPVRYVVTAELDTTGTAAPDGWKGVVRSARLDIEVVEEPVTLSSADSVWKPLLGSRFAQLRGDAAGALSIVEAWLASNPVSITVLSRKAELLDVLGRSREALAVVGQALDLFFNEHPKPTEPPEGLLQLQDRLIAKLMKK
jgi:hypothetical protein